MLALRDLLAWFDSSHVQGVIIGGVASSLLGKPRFTKDIDATILTDEERLDALVEDARRFGFEPRQADPVGFARQTRMLLLHHAATRLDVDVALAGLGFEIDAIERAEIHELSGLRLPLPTPGDLIVTKAAAHRRQDLDDIEDILDSHPETDLDEVRMSVEEYAEAAEEPEILAVFDDLIRQWKAQRG